MSNTFAIFLILHVILGLISVICSYAILLQLLRKNTSLSFLKKASLLNLISIWGSWLAGGYYYVLYYGPQVKPMIMKGAYTWAHTIFMEAKEHIFLMMPFVAIVFCALVFLLKDNLLANEKLKARTAALAAIFTILGTIMALSGVLISGGAR